MEELASILKQKGWQTIPPQINLMHPTAPPKPTHLIKLADCPFLLKGSKW